MEHLLEYATWSTRAQMDVALDGMTSLDDLPPVCAADGRRSICSFPAIQPVPCSWRPPRSQIMLYNQAYLPNCTFAHRLTHPVLVCKLQFWHLASRACHMTQLNQLCSICDHLIAPDMMLSTAVRMPYTIPTIVSSQAACRLLALPCCAACHASLYMGITSISASKLLGQRAQ